MLSSWSTAEFGLEWSFVVYSMRTADPSYAVGSPSCDNNHQLDSKKDRFRMNYTCWSKTVIEKLVSNGFDSALVGKVFHEAEAEIRLEYEKNELNSAGAHFVAMLQKYDLDLELARERGRGRTQSDLAAAYQITKEKAHVHWTRGFMKKVAILGWFRGEDVDFTSTF